MLVASGLLGCRYNTNDVDITSTDNDTALVLSKQCFDYEVELLYTNRQGKTSCTEAYNTSNPLYKHSNTGDTVIVRGNTIVRNLTMENKIKAFSNQR